MPDKKMFDKTLKESEQEKFEQLNLKADRERQNMIENEKRKKTEREKIEREKVERDKIERERVERKKFMPTRPRAVMDVRHRRQPADFRTFSCTLSVFKVLL